MADRSLPFQRPLKLSPSLAGLLGEQSVFWPSTLSQCLLVMRPSAAVVTIQLAKDVESFSAARPALIDQLVGDHLVDISVRLTEAAQKMGAGALPSSSATLSGGTDGNPHNPKPRLTPRPLLRRWLKRGGTVPRLMPSSEMFST